MSDLTQALTAYVATLAASADATTPAEDRAVYTGHLAEAARMYAALHTGNLKVFRERVASERRAFGWGFLSGDTGAATEESFASFIRAVESHLT
jgi:hypothetical protein